MCTVVRDGAVMKVSVCVLGGGGGGGGGADFRLLCTELTSC